MDSLTLRGELLAQDDACVGRILPKELEPGSFAAHEFDLDTLGTRYSVLFRGRRCQVRHLLLLSSLSVERNFVPVKLYPEAWSVRNLDEPVGDPRRVDNDGVLVVQRADDVGGNWAVPDLGEGGGDLGHHRGADVEFDV